MKGVFLEETAFGEFYGPASGPSRFWPFWVILGAILGNLGPFGAILGAAQNGPKWPKMPQNGPKMGEGGGAKGFAVSPSLRLGKTRGLKEAKTRSPSSTYP